LEINLMPHALLVDVGLRTLIILTVPPAGPASWTDPEPYS